MQCTTICKQRIHACLLVEEGVAGRASRDRDLARMLLAGGVLAVGGSVAKPHVTVGTVQVLGGFGHHASSAIAGAALKQREVSPVLLAGKVRAKVGRLATPPRATHLTIKWPGQRVSAVGLAQAAAPPHQECRGRCTSHGRCDVPSEIVDGGPHFGRQPFALAWRSPLICFYFFIRPKKRISGNLKMILVQTEVCFRIRTMWTPAIDAMTRLLLWRAAPGLARTRSRPSSARTTIRPTPRSSR